MKTNPFSAASAWAWAAASARVAPCSTISAPQAAARVTLVAGVKRGITMVAAMPSRLAWRATAWAWLPADIAMTPERRSAGESRASRLAAPRSLKAPVGCRFSSLSTTSAPVARDRASLWIVGLRSTRPAMRAAAASTSASAIMQRDGPATAGSDELDAEDLIGPVAARGGDRDAVADLLADQRLGERRGNRQPAELDVGLVQADDLVLGL